MIALDRARPDGHILRSTAVGMGLCLAIGALTAVQWLAMVILAAVVGFVVLLGRAYQRIRSVYTVGTLILIGGYIVMNRGFAGFHVAAGSQPVFVGEIAMVVLAIPTIVRVRREPLGAMVVILVLWMAYNAALTIWRLPEFAIDSIRDAAIWYYGAFILVGIVAWRDLDMRTVRGAYALIFTLTFAFIPLAILGSVGAIAPIIVPFSDTLLIGDNRWDSFAIHLIGAVALFVTSSKVARVPWSRWLTPLLLVCALALMAALQVRAAFVGLVGIMGVFVLYRLWRPVLLIVLAAAAATVLLLLTNVEIETTRGVVSARSVIERQASTIGVVNGTEEETSPLSAASTANWRLIWWQALLTETVQDPSLLLLGRGYGPDLRDAVVGLATSTRNWDQGTEYGRPVRSPHNLAITMLARSGVIGVTLWLLLLGFGFQRIVLAIRACDRAGDTDAALFGLWLATYLVAMLLVSMFGVIMEGPFGAIPFFFCFGLANAWSSDRLRRVESAGYVRRTIPAPA